YLHRRDNFSVAMMYSKKKAGPEDIFSYMKGSSDYQHFVDSIGWPVGGYQHLCIDHPFRSNSVTTTVSRQDSKTLHLLVKQRHIMPPMITRSSSTCAA